MVQRIALLGSDISHAVKFSEILNVEEHPDYWADSGARVHAIWGEDPKRTAEVARQVKIPVVASTPQEAVAESDLVFVITRDGGTHLEGEGGYALAEYLFTRRWSVGTRVDYVHSCPGFPNSLCTRIESDKDIEDRREWAASGILTFKPSRFLNFRLQYKHTDRNYAEDSDEILAQALFIIGFERPGPF